MVPPGGAKQKVTEPKISWFRVHLIWSMIRCINKWFEEHSIYFIDQLDSVVPLQRLDCHSSGINQLGQVYGLACIDTPQIDQVLEPL